MRIQPSMGKPCEQIPILLSNYKRLREEVWLMMREIETDVDPETIEAEEEGEGREEELIGISQSPNLSSADRMWKHLN
jgi:hypothetical protein